MHSLPSHRLCCSLIGWAGVESRLQDRDARAVRAALWGLLCVAWVLSCPAAVQAVAGVHASGCCACSAAAHASGCCACPWLLRMLTCHCCACRCRVKGEPFVEIEYENKQVGGRTMLSVPACGAPCCGSSHFDGMAAQSSRAPHAAAMQRCSRQPVPRQSTAQTDCATGCDAWLAGGVDRHGAADHPAHRCSVLFPSIDKLIGTGSIRRWRGSTRGS